MMNKHKRIGIWLMFFSLFILVVSLPGMSLVSVILASLDFGLGSFMWLVGHV